MKTRRLCPKPWSTLSHDEKRSLAKKFPLEFHENPDSTWTVRGPIEREGCNTVQTVTVLLKGIDIGQRTSAVEPLDEKPNRDEGDMGSEGDSRDEREWDRIPVKVR